MPVARSILAILHLQTGRNLERGLMEGCSQASLSRSLVSRTITHLAVMLWRWVILTTVSSKSHVGHHLQEGFICVIVPPAFRSQYFGAYVNTNWEACQATGSSCLLDYRDPTDITPVLPPNKCSLGSVPNYYVRHPSSAHVDTEVEHSLPSCRSM